MKIDINISGTLDKENMFNVIAKLNYINTYRVGKLDLSGVDFVKPSGLILLLQVLDILVELDEITFPERKTLSYMARMGFFKAVQPIINVPNEIKEINENVIRKPNNQTLIDITKIEGKLEIRKTLEYVNSQARNILVNELNYTNSDVDDFVVLLSEILGNIPRHSGSIGYICAQVYRYPRTNIKYIYVCVSDIGIGIKKSYLNENFTIPSHFTDEKALKLAVIQEQSSKERGGNGFKGIKEITSRLNGIIEVKSGSAELSVNKRIPTCSVKPDFKGTQIFIKLPEKLD